MDESYYTARLVITEGCEDRLDMTITFQNAQQLLRASSCSGQRTPSPIR